MFTKIRAIHMAVKNVEEAAKTYKDNFGIEATSFNTLPDLGVKNALIPIGDAVIELLEPLNPQEGPVAKFLQNRGEGVYMAAFEVENIDSAVKSLQDKGVPLLNADPESQARGIPVFIHPKAGKGLMIEVVEKR